MSKYLKYFPKSGDLTHAVVHLKKLETETECKVLFPFFKCCPLCFNQNILITYVTYINIL